MVDIRMKNTKKKRNQQDVKIKGDERTTKQFKDCLHDGR